MEIILDTNVLVSGLLYPARPIARVVDALFLTALQHERLIAVYDRRILEEYATVLARPHLASRFEQGKASALLERLTRTGADAGSVAMFDGALPDEKDRPFIEVALATGAPIVTGNARHFPPSLGVQLIAAADLVRQLGV